MAPDPDLQATGHVPRKYMLPRPRPLVVVSGLPASDESNLGAAVAEKLALPLIDKDEVLESRFDDAPQAP